MYSANAPELPYDTPPLFPLLAQEPLELILQLIRSENVGPVTFFQLMKRYKSVEKALKAIPMLAMRGGAKRHIRICPSDMVKAEIERTRAFGAEFIPYGHAHYPALLMQINDPPPVIMVRGHAHLLAKPSIIAMVGSRNASANGCKYAARLATELGEKGYIISSGLARGIDGYAHKGALSTGSIAVIAGGIDHIYPPEHKQLFADMAEQGVIVSESPFGSAPQHRHFPARNRIIAGMSVGTIVVEATKKSGSLITAKYALEYNRDIFAVPGFPMDPRSAGTNHLIQEGAMLVNSAHDIIDYLHNKPTMVQEHSHHNGFSDMSVSIGDDENLDAERDAILSLIGSSPIAVEELIVMTGIEARIVSVILLELELAGMITRHSGGRVSRHYPDE
ncbi:MAG: DNA-protecting protein DprA [Sphaerospermopsis sp. SIO1G2]|nr:DNA-protecting protein DprA [Sphaerospermopsis sp. SIO1G2]